MIYSNATMSLGTPESITFAATGCTITLQTNALFEANNDVQLYGDVFLNTGAVLLVQKGFQLFVAQTGSIHINEGGKLIVNESCTVVGEVVLQQDEVLAISYFSHVVQCVTTSITPTTATTPTATQKGSPTGAANHKSASLLGIHVALLFFALLCDTSVIDFAKTQL